MLNSFVICIKFCNYKVKFRKLTDSGAVTAINNVSAASPSRQAGTYKFVNCVNVTADAENSGAGRTGGCNPPMFDVTIDGYQSAKTFTITTPAHYKRKKGIYKNT